MNTKKVLIFIDWYKPGFKAGGPIRSVSNIVDYLHERAKFFIVTRNTDYLDTIPYSTIKSNEWNEIDGASVYYLSNDNLNYKSIKEIIRDIQPSIIYCNSLFSLYFTLIPLYISKKTSIHRILATRGMLSSGSLGVKKTKKKIFLFSIKFMNVFKNVTFQATSLDEHDDIKNNVYANQKINVIQNLPSKNLISLTEKVKHTGQLNLVYVGRIAPEKNTLYSIEILANAKQQINYDIYGPIYNKAYWSSCEKLIKSLPSNIIVRYQGILPHEQLNDTLRKYHSLLLPSTGENFGHIIIEAMTNSCIPIISNKTPWKDLELNQVGFDIDLDNSVEFTTKIDTIALMNQVEYNTISKNAQEYAQEVIENKELIKKYINLFQI